MRKQRPVLLAALSILFLFTLFYLIIFTSPDKSLTIGNLKLSPTQLFFVSFFVFSLSLFTFIFKALAQGLLISFLIVGFLILRLNNLTHPIFVVLLIALFIALELLFRRKK
ncbi:MAG TPA: hypothetical protein VFA93_02115 [Patescibacteria group bacterium]|nr:hypothetical protein [Patescibacteria group bacterium]